MGRFFVMSADREHMETALELAARGRGLTSPNPMVGCVVVKDGEIVGEGFHERAGMPHAEVNAIDDAGGGMAGATLYVTLEPCCTHGRTPPCTDLIIDHAPQRVVVAMEDPNPAVSGRGIEQIRSAGIKVDIGVLEKDARRLNEAYTKHVTTGLPFVIAKCGMSLDGKIATRTGDSKWVTGEASRQMVHRLRNEVDAIMVGSRTVMIDNPALTTRIVNHTGKDPVRIILDEGGYLDESARVFQHESAAPTWVVLPDDGEFAEADQTLHIPRGREGVDIELLMRQLGERGLMSVLIEGGGTTHASAFEAGVVDKILFFIAPKIIGGRDAITAVEGEGAEKMCDAVLLERMRAIPVGEDILIEAYVSKSFDSVKKETS